jgi:hypothetical protein
MAVLGFWHRHPAQLPIAANVLGSGRAPSNIAGLPGARGAPIGAHTAMMAGTPTTQLGVPAGLSMGGAKPPGRVPKAGILNRIQGLNKPRRK